MSRGRSDDRLDRDLCRAAGADRRGGSVTTRPTRAPKGAAARPVRPTEAAAPPPKSLKVGHATFRIDAAELDENYGITYTRDSRIVYTPRQSRCNLRDTLLHESLHAVFDTAGVTRGEGEAMVAATSEEPLIAILTPWVLGLLRENPDLVAFLTATDA